jgi:hypothetical protein
MATSEPSRAELLRGNGLAIFVLNAAMPFCLRPPSAHEGCLVDSDQFLVSGKIGGVKSSACGQEIGLDATYGVQLIALGPGEGSPPDQVFENVVRVS